MLSKFMEAVPPILFCTQVAHKTIVVVLTTIAIVKRTIVDA